MDGKDGITPKFKIENDYWYISYDNESTWTQLGKATGEDGKDGEDGISGDPMFTDIDYETNTDYVILRCLTVRRSNCPRGRHSRL